MSIKDLKETKLFRVIIELSPVINNDEVVMYTKKKVSTPKDIKKYFGIKGTWCEPRVMLCRPHYYSEGKPPKKNIPIRRNKKKEAEQTKILDALFTIKAQIDFTEEMNRHRLDKITPSQMLARLVGDDFYDCMSGGMDGKLIQVIHLICKIYDIDLTEETYPKAERLGGGWYNLHDFLKETGEIPSLGSDYFELIKQLQLL